MQYKVVF